MLKPISGTYKIKTESAKYFTKRHTKYNFRVIDSRGGEVFIEPVRQGGDSTSGHTSATLVRWADMNDLEKVNE